MTIDEHVLLFVAPIGYRPILSIFLLLWFSFLKPDFRAPSRLRISEFTQNFWVFLFYIADFWQTFWVIWENGSNWSNLRLKMKFFALGRLKNHNVPHLHPNSTMFMPLDRLQLKIYAFSGKFNVCSKRVLLLWIKICRNLCSKLRFLLRNTGVDSDYTQNFWGKICRLGSLLLSKHICKLITLNWSVITWYHVSPV